MNSKSSKGQLEDLESAIEKYKGRFKTKRALARYLASLGYSKFSIVTTLHVSGSSFKEPKPRGELKVASNKSADEVVMEEGYEETLEQVVKWVRSLSKQTVQDIMKIGKVLIEDGVEEKAAALGVTPERYLHLAINFYERWREPVLDMLSDEMANKTTTLTQSRHHVEDLIEYIFSIYGEAIKMKIIMEVFRQVGLLDSNQKNAMDPTELRNQIREIIENSINKNNSIDPKALLTYIIALRTFN